MNLRKLWLKLLAFLTGGGANDPAMEALERGLSCVDAGDVDSAIAAFTEAIRLDPEFAEAYYNRGVAYGSKGELDKAIVEGDLAIGEKCVADTADLRTHQCRSTAVERQIAAYWLQGDQEVYSEVAADTMLMGL